MIPMRKEDTLMRRMASVLAVLLLLVALAVPAFAAEDDFVPSIGYKDGPEIDKSEMNKENVTPCLVVTSILQAKNKKTDIPQSSRDLLLEVYDKLLKNEMELPMEEDYVVRELIDISFRQSDCVEKDHKHKEWLSQDNTSIEITLETGIPTDVEVQIFVYVNEQWVPVPSVTNSDSSITCTFEDICPVAICVPRDTNDTPADTGDTLGQMLWLWILLLILSLGAVIGLILSRRKFLR